MKIDLARATLVQVLDHWKSGGTIDELRKHSPEIVAQDVSWSSNLKLRDYRVIGNDRAEDANWFCEVELSLVPADGGDATQKTVTYVVGTDPVLTVFRAIL